MILVTLLVAFRLVDAASSSELQALPETFVCADGRVGPDYFHSQYSCGTGTHA